MGDRPSGSIACAALRKTAEMEKNNFPCEAEIIQKSSFIDDIIDSADCVENVNKITKNISGILSKAGFHIKEWVISNNNDVSIDLKDFKIFENKCERVLGVSWNVSRDKLKYDLELHFSKGSVIDVCEPNSNTLKIPEILTKRLVLSKLNGIYDPLGLIGAF